MPLFSRRSDKADALGKIPLLSGLSKSHLMEVARHADELTVPAGDVLTREGEAGREAFLIVKGSVTVRRKGRKLATRGPGDVIGEMSLLDDQPRSATCKTDEETVLLVMSRSDFSSLISEVPGLARKLLASMSRRLREAEKHND